jgi:hypothetical protein
MAEETGISCGLSQDILTEHFGIRHMSAMFVS